MLALSVRAILVIGSYLFDKGKRNLEKKAEVPKSVRSDMRRLANLYIKFLAQDNIVAIHSNSADMFRRENFVGLKTAIEEYTSVDEDNFKSGLKAELFYLIKASCKALKGSFLVSNQDNFARAIDDFMSVMELSRNYIFAEATYRLNKNRQVKLRKPNQLPLEEDVQNVRNHVLERIGAITTDSFNFWDKHTYVEVRDCCCSRLTLFNARRGGEPARLLLTEFKEAVDGVWLDRERLDEIDHPIEKALIKSLKITYQSGKGSVRLVPVLIPQDCVPALQILADPEKRKVSGVAFENPFLFPSTQNSTNHASGWHTTHNICVKLNINSAATLTATKNRHRVSTLFASLDLPYHQQQAFYEHMGHGESINQHIYQAPPALTEILTVGKHLKTIDNTSEEITETSTEEANEGYVFTFPPARTSDPVESDPDFYPDEDYDINCFDSIQGKRQCKTLKVKDVYTSSEDEEINSTEKEKSLENVAADAKGRTYSQWTKEYKKALFDEFSMYIYRKSTNPLPARPVVASFLKRHNIPFTYETVRVKINNERAKVDRLKKRRKKEMNIK